MKTIPYSLPAELSLALNLHNFLIVGGSAPTPEVIKILESCNYDRITILHKEIELCSGYQCPAAYAILSDAYIFLGASYRQQAIQCLTKYLENPSWIPCCEQYRHTYLAGRWAYLGKSYEGEYQFDLALKAYWYELKLTPSFPSPYIEIARIMRKKNQIDLAIQFLKAVRKTKHYQNPCSETHFRIVIDSHLSELENKLEKGYMYKPRPHKNKQ